MKYYCTTCSSEVDGFFPGGAEYEIIERLGIVGMGRRRNKNCSMCRSNDRERLVTIFMRNSILATLKRPITLLHIAPESMLTSILIKHEQINYLRADKFAEDYYYPEGTMEMDIRNILFEDCSFDFIICNHVLEHIEEDIMGMKELYRVLKPTGRAILQVPISEALVKTYEDRRVKTKKKRIEYFGQRNHVRIYAWDYTQRLESVGFKVEVVNMLEVYGEAFMEQNGLNKKEKIIFCHK